METQNAVMILPKEVQELALKVSAEKQKEVNDVLNQIFQGTADWENQVESIVVKDVNDVMSINLAETARKNSKTARLAAEKIFDAKREVVQSEMINFKLEDALWLKSKQIMQLKFKAIEEKAEFKANYVKRFESEQKELRTQLRLEKVAKFNPEITRFEIENITDEMFSILLSGLEKTFNDKIEAEKKAKEEQEAKEKAEIAERERIKKENEQLKAEAEAKKIQDKKRDAELMPYIIFICDYSKMLNMDEKDYQKELSEIKIGAKQHYEYEAKKTKDAKIESDKQAKIFAELQAKAKAEAEAREKVEKELKAKQIADAKAQFEKEQKEKAELAAIKKAEKEPDKEKLIKLINEMVIGKPELKSKESQEILKNISEKFINFKTWAKQQIETI